MCDLSGLPEVVVDRKVLGCEFGFLGFGSGRGGG